MELSQVVDVLKAKVYVGEDKLNRRVHSAFSSDLMSDVLAYVEEDTLLITGLMNQQVIRTAEMLDLKAILFVRGKIPTQDIIDLAEEDQMILMSTAHSMFTVSGLLYEEGLRGIQL